MVDAMLRRSDRAGTWKQGDEVIVPALSWPTTVWPLCQLGLTPVFVDVDRETLAIDLDSAKSALSPKTRGMFLIHVLGRAPDVARYTAFCEANGIALIEDACEGLGAHSGGTHVGRFGAMGSFSCYFSHHISTIEGGVIITSDDALRDDLTSLRAHGWTRDRSDKARWHEEYADIDPRFLFVTGGYNVRPTEFQGAVGRVQLKKLDAMLDAREELARNVKGWISRHPWLELIGASTLVEGDARNDRRRGRRHSWMTLPMRLSPDAPLDLRAVKQHLERAGVETRPIIAGNLARHPAVRQFNTRSAPDLSVSNELLEHAFMIGCHPARTTTVASAMETLKRAFETLPA
jgi:CDP-6-deoxy-D-xylo-4-hexulose-3-dehydrase